MSTRPHPATLPIVHTEPEARLPLADAPDARVMAFREEGKPQTHLAIHIGQPARAELPLVRLHSSCLTGDLLGSLRCDCGDQLREGLRRIAAHGWGVLLYLDQEGRGIGIEAKLRAYRLQDEGLDTYAANEALGFAADQRDYAVAAAMLAKQGLRRIRLLTNNPAKLEALQALGIEVAERVPLVIAAGEENRDYLAAKATKGGHWL